MSVSYQLPDGASMEFEQPASAFEIAGRISKKLAKQALAAKANDNLKVVDGLMNLQGSVSMARTAALCHQIAMNQYMADPGCDNVKMIDNVWCHSNPLMEGIMHLNFMTSLPSSGLFGIAGADVKV